MNPIENENDIESDDADDEMKDGKKPIEVDDQTATAKPPTAPKEIDIDHNRIVVANGYMLVEGAKADYCLDGKSIVLVRVEHVKKAWKVTFTPPARDLNKKPVKEIAVADRDAANALVREVYTNLVRLGIEASVAQLEDGSSN